MTQVFDTHFQLGVDHWASQNTPAIDSETSSRFLSQSSLDDLASEKADLATLGLELSGVMGLPFPSAPNQDYTEPNAVLREYAISDASVHPIYAVNPHAPAERARLEELLASGDPCAGIKLNPFLGRPGGYSLLSLVDDEPLVELIRDHQLTVAMHVGTGREHLSRPMFPKVPADPRTAIKLAEELPEVNFFYVHLLRLSREALSRAAECPNAYVDTSGLRATVLSESGSDILGAEDAVAYANVGPSALLTQLLEEFDISERLVFGSAWPFCCWWGSTPAEEARVVLDAEIDSSARTAILGGNAERLLTRSGR